MSHVALLLARPRSAAAAARSRRRVPARRGTSLIEVVVSSLVISVMLVAVLRTLGATASAGAAADERTRALELAEQLLAEVRTRAYADPESGTTSFGRESGESPHDRARWDDVDDYHGWSATPPVDADGEPVPDADGWTRRVSVAHVDPADPRTVSGSDTGLKRIVVSIERGDRVVVRRHAIVAAAGAAVAAVPGEVADGPRAAVVAPARRGPAPLEVTFDARGSADPRGAGLQGRWDFGDGVTATGLKVSHTYGKPGRHVASVRVTDELGRVDVASVLVVVEAP